MRKRKHAHPTERIIDKGAISKKTRPKSVELGTHMQEIASGRISYRQAGRYQLKE